MLIFGSFRAFVGGKITPPPLGTPLDWSYHRFMYFHFGGFL